MAEGLPASGPQSAEMLLREGVLLLVPLTDVAG